MPRSSRRTVTRSLRPASVIVLFDCVATRGSSPKVSDGIIAALKPTIKMNTSNLGNLFVIVSSSLSGNDFQGPAYQQLQTLTKLSVTVDALRRAGLQCARNRNVGSN